MTIAFRLAEEAKTKIRKIPRDRHVDALWSLLCGEDNVKITDVACIDLQADEAEQAALWRAAACVRVRSRVVEIIDIGVQVPEQKLLAPLRNVGAEPGAFEVALPWPRWLETSGEFADAGFVVRRPPESVGTVLSIQWDSATLCERGFRRRGLREWLSRR